MSRRALLVAMSGLSLMTCGSEDIEVAELGEVCGKPSPFRVLELEPDEELVFDRPLRIGDRVLWLVSHRAEAGPNDLFPATDETAVWSTGLCGESPLRIATNIDRLFTVDVWPKYALGCRRESGDVVVLDPTGERETQIVFADIPHNFGCGLRWTPHGVLSVDAHEDEDQAEALGALVLHPYAADPYAEAPAPIVLADPIRINESSIWGGGIVGSVVRTFDDFVLALTPEDVLIRVDLASAALGDLRTGVAAFDASQSGRYVLWQDDLVTLADERYPRGQMFFADLEAGTSAALGESSLGLSLSPMFFADHGFILLGLGALQRLFALPALDHLDIPADRFVNAHIDGDRWLVSSIGAHDYDVVDLRSGDSRRLFPHEVALRGIDGESVELLQVPGCCIDGSHRDEGPIWRVRLDGAGEPERLAPRATRMTRLLADGRYLGPVSVNTGWHGALVLTEPETGEELWVDDHVGALSLDTARVEGEGIISYSVADGDRSGVYLARLPPRATDRAGAPASRPASVEARVVDLIPGDDGRPLPRLRAVDDAPTRP